MNNTFSIITVVYNAVDTIEKTIQSVLSQDYDNYEYIIIDGASDDGTVEVIERYSDKLAYWVSESDGGIYDAMNKGIEHSSGGYLAFIGADDYYLENAFENVAYYIEHNTDNKLFCFNVKWILNDQLISPPLHQGFHNPEQLRYIGNMFPHQAVFASRMLFDRYGLFSTKYKVLSDYDWLLKVYNGGESFFCKDIAVAAFGKSGLSSVQRKKALLECGMIMCQAARVAEKNDAPYKINSEVMAHHFYISLLEYLNGPEEKNYTREIIGAFGKKDIVLFGYGNNGRCCYKWLNECDIEVSEIWDNQAQSNQSIDGIEIKKPYYKTSETLMIIITCYEAFFDVCNQLDELGYLYGIDYIGAGVLVIGCGE